MISFSVGREGLAGCHLKNDLVAKPYRPLPELLTSHLTQGVIRYCISPGWECDDQPPFATLDLLAEATEGITPEDDELPEPASLTDKLHWLTLESRAGNSGTKGEYAKIEEFSMEEREYGEGESAFESYLTASLSGNRIVPTP